MIINWYGEGCFKVQTGGITLLTDPFESSTGLTPARGKNEVILKTLTPWPAGKSDSEPEDGQAVRGAGEYEIKGLEIKGFGVPGESTDKFFKTAYLVKAEDLNLCFLGHLAEYPEPQVLEELEKIDLLFIPAGGKPFLKQESAVKLIKQLDAKVVVASFFKIPGLKRPSDDVKDFAKELGQKAEPEEKLVIKKKDLLEQKGFRLVVLKV